MVSLDSTKVTRVVGISFQICTISTMSCLNKTKKKPPQSVIIAGSVVFIV